jgi:hypothetical protein
MDNNVVIGLVGGGISIMAFGFMSKWCCGLISRKKKKKEDEINNLSKMVSDLEQKFYSDQEENDKFLKEIREGLNEIRKDQEEIRKDQEENRKDQEENRKDQEENRKNQAKNSASLEEIRKEQKEIRRIIDRNDEKTKKLLYSSILLNIFFKLKVSLYQDQGKFLEKKRLRISFYRSLLWNGHHHLKEKENDFTCINGEHSQNIKYISREIDVSVDECYESALNDMEESRLLCDSQMKFLMRVNEMLLKYCTEYVNLLPNNMITYSTNNVSLENVI